MPILDKEKARGAAIGAAHKEEILEIPIGMDLDRQIWEKLFGKSLPTLVYRTDFPYYSAEVRDAWLVVEEMGRDGYDMSLLLMSNNPDYKPYWYCDFRTRGSRRPPVYEWVDHQQTAPEAICRAALLSIRKNLGKEGI